MSVPLIVTATFGEADFQWLDGLRRAHFPIERNRVPAHLTLFHHLPPGQEQPLVERLRAAVHAPEPRARLVSVLNLGRGVAFGVSSPELDEIRADLADAFSTCLLPQDAASWRPHVTVQNKVAPDQARTLAVQLKSLLPKPLRITGLALWRYRDGPWEAVRQFRFNSAGRCRRS